MIFTLEPLKAAEGDCLLLHWGKPDDIRLAVIDGGPGRIYEEILRPRLLELAEAREIPLLVDLAMVSHMDSDHIVGVRKLFAQMVSEIESHEPPEKRVAKVQRLWLNVFNDILNDAVDEYYKRLTAAYQATVGGEPNPELIDRIAEAFQARQGLNREQAEFEAEAIGALLAGHNDGRSLRDDHAYLRAAGQIASLNHPYQTRNGKATLLTSRSGAEPIELEGLQVQVVAPDQAEIDALQVEFDKYIKENRLSVQAVLAAYADDSAKNLSSIVCVVSMKIGETTRSILLTGDARGDHILRGIKRAKLLDGDGRLWVDVLKVPHHGSDRNIEPEFFNQILADHYIFSGNGKHGNPDRSTLEWLFDARGQDAEYAVYLTYGVEETDELRRIEHLKKSKLGPWRHEKHSLQALFEQREYQGYRFKVQAGAPFMIHLGDEAAEF